jgi:hypothetical protein
MSTVAHPMVVTPCASPQRPTRALAGAYTVMYVCVSVSRTASRVARHGASGEAERLARTARKDSLLLVGTEARWLAGWRLTGSDREGASRRQGLADASTGQDGTVQYRAVLR